MKVKKRKQKLTLNKMTIAHLRNDWKKELKGGRPPMAGEAAVAPDSNQIGGCETGYPPICPLLVLISMGFKTC